MIPPRPTRRGLLLAALPAVLPLAACSVLPERPYQEVQRFTLAPERPQRQAPPPRGPVLLVRTFRAAPGLELRGLRLVGADGEVTTTYWQEWTAPPGDLAEEAVRRWLTASGRFGAVTAPGSRLPADCVLEGELIRLQAEPAAGRARVALSVLLLTEPQGLGEARILGQFVVEGSAPLPAAARETDTPAAQAAAMTAALAAALAELERRLAELLRQDAGTPARRRRGRS